MNNQYIPDEPTILAMDGTEDWFARILNDYCEHDWRDDHRFQQSCMRCGVVMQMGDLDVPNCTIPPPITEPLEVIAFRLGKECLPDEIAAMAYKVNYLLYGQGCEKWQAKFDEIEIIRAALLAEKRKII